MSVPVTSSRAEIPSWAISVALHGILVFILLFWVGSCEIDKNREMILGNPDDKYRSFGLLPTTDKPEKTDSHSESKTAPDVNPVKSQNPDQSFQKQDPDAPPTKTPFEPDKLLAGPGIKQPQPGGSRPHNPLDPFSKPNGVRLPGAAGPDPSDPKKVGFFGVKAAGQKFVFVLDISASMQSEAAPNKPALIRYAQSELIRSLRTLKPNQEFGVIFYNENVTPLKLGKSGGYTKVANRYKATPKNIRAAEQRILQVRPRLGTKHKPPLVAALRMQPDAIFFLTDGDTPGLEGWELDELRTLSRRLASGKSAIHCIEFGRFGKPFGDNFLKKLSEQHRGSYRYVNMSKLARESR